MTLTYHNLVLSAFPSLTLPARPLDHVIDLQDLGALRRRYPYSCLHCSTLLQPSQFVFPLNHPTVCTDPSPPIHVAQHYY